MHEYINLRTRAFMISTREENIVSESIENFEVHHFFPKLIKLALHCIDTHLQFWISGGWFVVFYVTSKALENICVLCWSVIYADDGYSLFIYWWLKIIVFVWEMLISKWDLLKIAHNTSTASSKFVVSSKKTTRSSA